MKRKQLLSLLLCGALLSGMAQGCAQLSGIAHYLQYYRYINGFLIDFPNKLVENPDILDFLPVDGLRF